MTIRWIKGSRLVATVRMWIGDRVVPTRLQALRCPGLWS
jgi:hypothetical protein